MCFTGRRARGCLVAPQPRGTKLAPDSGLVSTLRYGLEKRSKQPNPRVDVQAVYLLGADNLRDIALITMAVSF